MNTVESENKNNLWTRRLGRNRRKWEHKNRVNLNKRGLDGVDKNKILRDMAKEDFCENGHEPLSYKNCVLFLYSSSHYYFEWSDCAAWNSEFERFSPE